MHDDDLWDIDNFSYDINRQQIMLNLSKNNNNNIVLKVIDES